MEPRSVALVALLSPRIAVVVVAVVLPEAGLVVLEELQSAHPLGALPEVQVRNEQARGTAVLGLEGLAIDLIRDPSATAGHVLEREIRCVAPVAPRAHVLG